MLKSMWSHIFERFVNFLFIRQKAPRVRYKLDSYLRKHIYRETTARGIVIYRDNYPKDTTIMKQWHKWVTCEVGKKIVIMSHDTCYKGSLGSLCMKK